MDMYTFATSTSARVVDDRLDLTQLRLQYCIDANLSMFRNRHKKSQFSVANTEYEIVQERILSKTPILYVELSSAARIRWNGHFHPQPRVQFDGAKWRRRAAGSHGIGHEN
ncbi:unnamed protein product [Calypogeia fissa]